MKKKIKVAVVDDEQIILSRLETALTAAGYEVTTFLDPLLALKAMSLDPPQLVITDVKMDGMDGIELLQRIKVISPTTEVIVITGFSSLDAAVEATKQGAFYYLAKPFKLEQLKLTLRQATEKAVLALENSALREQIYERRRFRELIGESNQMRKIYETIAKLSQVECHVMIQGEPGTGKELIAQALHQDSPRAPHPFTACNCTSLPEEQLALELFGSVDSGPGLLEKTGEGTLFLEEVDSLPPSLQQKLLRCVQNRILLREGGSEAIKIDLRVLAATTKDMKKLVENSEFRHDLYYRLNVVTIEVPPLRQRKEDIPLLVVHFLAKYNLIFKKEIKEASQDFMRLLLAYNFRGNVQELENIIERAVAIAESNILTSNELPPDLNILSITALAGEGILNLKEYEDDYIRAVYKFSGNNQQRTAELLGISRTTLWRKFKEMGINP